MVSTAKKYKKQTKFKGKDMNRSFLPNKANKIKKSHECPFRKKDKNLGLHR